LSDPVALLSPCGFGNLGDAAILDSAIAAVRRRLPNARPVAFTMNPDDTRARHGIEAHPILGFSRPFYPVNEVGGARRRVGPRASAWLARVPPLRKLRTLAATVAAERAHEAACAVALAGCRLVIVAGGGQLDELWGGPWAHPFALWRWSAIARRVGARFVALSVGTGKLASPLGRRFARRALAGAAVVSFRDAGSRRLAEEAGVVAAGTAALAPDLAYAVPRPTSAPAARRARPLVAVSPIAHHDPRAWPDEDARAYTAHVQMFAELARRLLADGADVAFFTTNRSDGDTVADVRAALGPADAARVVVADTSGVERLLSFLETADAVVACRLHGVLLSHVAARPVVALAYERKVEALMADMGEDAACLPLASTDGPRLHAVVAGVLGARPGPNAAIRARVDERATRVERQYDELLGSRRD